VTVKLPAAALSAGRVYVVKRVAGLLTSPITVSSAGGLVEGAAAQVLNSLLTEAITLQSDGSAWYALSWYWQ